MFISVLVFIGSRRHLASLIYVYEGSECDEVFFLMKPFPIARKYIGYDNTNWNCGMFRLSTWIEVSTVSVTFFNCRLLTVFPTTRAPRSAGWTKLFAVNRKSKSDVVIPLPVVVVCPPEEIVTVAPSRG